MVVRDQAEVVHDVAFQLFPAFGHLVQEIQEPSAEVGEARMPSIVGDSPVQDSPESFEGFRRGDAGTDPGHPPARVDAADLG